MGSIGNAALWGGVIGGVTGGLSGYLRDNQFQNALEEHIANPDNWLASCDQCSAIYKGKGGILLSHAVATGSRGVSDFSNWFSNAYTSLGMLGNWLIGSNYSGYYKNDIVADALRNANGVGEARNYFYSKYRNNIPLNASVTNYQSDFGLKGLLFEAGFDPIEQYIGSYRVDIHRINRSTLQYTVSNNTSFTSLTAGLGPSWNKGPMRNYWQRYVFTEQINFNR